MGDDPDPEPLALAEAAHALVESDAARAAEMAERAVQVARRQREPAAEVAALHALGFARHELGDARAVRTLRAAVRVGERNGLARRAALARRPLAIYLAYRGEIGSALHELDLACASLDGLELARSEVFRIAVLGLAGRAPPSMASSNRAVHTLRRAGDAIWEARLLGNRGFLLAERGDANAAEPDLVRARDLFAGLGATSAALGAECELARVALTRGDIPTCLARLDAIDAADVPALHNSALELLRAKALVAGRLMSEARQALDLAQAVWRRAGIDDPEGRLEVVALTLLAGDPAGAVALARQAQRSFAARHRDVYGARAAGLWLAATIAAGAPLRPAALRSGRRAVATLTAAGWREDALRVQLSVARAAIELGSSRVARRELAACSGLRRRGPVADRVEAWHIEALQRLADSDPGGAQRAARRGLGLLEAHRAALGAPDLRALVSELGATLAQLGLRIALAQDDIDAALAWAERLRGCALRLAPVTPSSVSELRDHAAELRRVSAEIRRTERDGSGARTLVARQAALEASIRRLSRHTVGGPPAPSAIPGRQVIARALGTAALLELIELDGTLTAVALVDGRLTRHELGPAGPVMEELEWLRFSLARLTRRGHAAQRATALAGAQASAAALSHRLIAPVAQTLGDRRLVIVPTGSLHALPWSMLPDLHGRPLVIAPSVVTWRALEGTPRRRRRRVALVCGPRLRHGRTELAGIGALYPGAGVLTGSETTVAAVMRELDGATVAHLACHGRFRADSPLFSSLELADGPLNVYELQRMRRAPELIVLSACNLAISEARPGDELLGFAAALIGMGTRTIIASVVAVPDAAAKRLMVALHGHLRAGDSPAVALAKAQATLRPRESALAGFVCLGTG